MDAANGIELIPVGAETPANSKTQKGGIDDGTVRTTDSLDGKIPMKALHSLGALRRQSEERVPAMAASLSESPANHGTV
jgi:hypothetical protein